MIEIVEPTKAILTGYDSKTDRILLESHLKYKDKRVEFELNKHRHAAWFIDKYGQEKWQERLDELKELRDGNLLFEEDGVLWTYSGLAPYLADALNDRIINRTEYPDSQLYPWHKTLDMVPRPYQNEMVSRLLDEKHGAVEVGTGLGKTLAILLLIKELGLKTLVMAPSKSIARQLLKTFQKYLGKSRVGLFGDGRKDTDKLITVALSASLVRVKEGSKHWKALQSEIFIADESHLCPADTLRKVCFGLVKTAPYRFFFSGTQLRNDGLDLVLRGIIGRIVFKMTVKEGVDQGYLARPLFHVVGVESGLKFTSRDALRMQREHLYGSPEVAKAAAHIANLSISVLDRPTVILIQEMNQFQKLLPHLKHPFRFAHGGVDKKAKKKVAEQYWKSNPVKYVEEFNDGKIKLLVGTSCISTGTDIQPVEQIIYLQGGTSSIGVQQAIGRGTRLVPGSKKKDCFFTDFDVTNIDITHRHANVRRGIYNDVYGPVKEVQL